MRYFSGQWWFAILILVFPVTSAADYRLYLRDGSTVQVSGFEKKNGAILYERAGKTVVIPGPEILRIEPVTPATPAETKDQSEARLVSMQGKLGMQLGALLTRIETQGEKLTLTVSDHWYRLKDYERERIQQYVKTTWLN